MINSSQLGGWLSIHEDRTEWTCISNWLMTKYKPSYQKFAISLREDYISGIFLWHYPDGTTTFPLYEVWAPNHPESASGACVSMQVGDTVDAQNGQWVDGECTGDAVWGICEKM